MQKVTGFGGFFFRSSDPDELAKWYEAHLGVSPVPTSAETAPWVTEAGVTVFSPFSEDTDYFSSDKQFMLNFRVENLDAMITQLETAGIRTFNRTEMEGIGQFVHLTDPEGTPIELWQPA